MFNIAVPSPKFLIGQEDFVFRKDTVDHLMQADALTVAENKFLI